MSSNQRSSRQRRRRSAPITKKSSGSIGWSERFRNGIKRYWFVAVPALLVNAAFTIDHVIAKNNEDVYHVRIREYALEAVNVSPVVQDDVPLSETLQAHWVTTNDDGNLEGRISAIEVSELTSVPIEKLDVALLKKGEKIRNATTGNDGKFTLENVSPGVYTLVAAGQNGFLAYGVNVLPKLKAFDVLDQKTELQRQSLKHAYYVSIFNLPQDSVVEETLQIDAAAVPPEFSTLQRISKNYLPSMAALSVDLDNDDVKAIGKATVIRSGFQHALTVDGKLEGQIQPISTSNGQAAKLSDMNVFLIQFDVEAARVAVEESGKFTIEDVEPGVYSLVAAGKDGFAALSLELVGTLGEEGNQSSVQELDKIHYVSSRVADPKVEGTLGIAIITDPRDLAAIKQEIDRISNERNQQLLAQQNGPLVDQSGFSQGGFGQGSFADGGFGGSGGYPVDGGYGGTGGGTSGGGGGGGLGGRRGGLWTVAALGLGIAAISSNNDEDTNVSNPPPASRVQ